ncbi:urease accessory protein UreD [Solimonas marina]|uniref:Urease accessory protein UreD n=1 Tax=Solimonas marina TaxID=2714601 RepID=A0A969WDZ7_9GAMM|nr:urease accessory protein UreD [Solimonas marina]NKF23040.1 urease accessory protein UreD [Solimonas marina]
MTASLPNLHLPRAPALRRQRVDGALRLSYRADRDGITRLADLYQRAPCRVLFPDVDAGEPPQAVLLTTSGGLTGGDRLDIALQVGARARATFSTQAAEKLYRALDDEDDTRIDVTLDVGAAAWAEWLAQETILFDRARLRRSVTMNLGGDAHVLALESVVFGRRAMNERFDAGLLHDVWRIRRDGRLIWADAQHLAGHVQDRLDARLGYHGAAAAATLLLIGPTAAAQLDAVRDTLSALPVTGGATTLDGLLIVRLLGTDAMALRDAAVTVAGLLRARAGGLPARLPQVWYC